MKKVKVVIPPEALTNFPEEERAEIEAEIRKMFENFDPNNPPGQILERVAIDTACPNCGAPLTLEGTPAMTLPNGDIVETLECIPCDRAFLREASN